MNTKDKVIKAIQELPPDASIEDAMEKLYLLYKIDRGIKQADASKKSISKGSQKAYGEMVKLSSRIFNMLA